MTSVSAAARSNQLTDGPLGQVLHAFVPLRPDVSPSAAAPLVLLLSHPAENVIRNFNAIRAPQRAEYDDTLVITAISEQVN
jgi:hypothetical protein